MARRAISPDGPHRKHEIASVTMKMHTSSLERYSALPLLEAGVWFAASRIVGVGVVVHAPHRSINSSGASRAASGRI
jgi:hypothetical protein